jgi:hypothetical protein
MVSKAGLVSHDELRFILTKRRPPCFEETVQCRPYSCDGILKD